MAEAAAGGHRSAEMLLTPEEVAERLRVTRPTVYTWLKKGQLRGLRAGKAWRVRTEDLENFMRGVPSEPDGPVAAMPDPRTYREVLLAALRAGDSDPEARERLFALPGGEEALKKAIRLKEARRRFAGLGISSEEFMREKHEEAERELLEDMNG
jgi:excisionase family DNA binding protein